MKLTTVAIAALLILSPAYAAHKGHASGPPAQQCIPLEAFISNPPPTYKLVARLEGKRLAVFSMKFAKNMFTSDTPLVNEVDTILIFKQDDDKSVMISFTHGCAVDVGALSNRLVVEFLDDGSI